MKIVVMQSTKICSKSLGSIWVEEYLENLEMELEAALQSGFRHGNWGYLRLWNKA